MREEEPIGLDPVDQRISYAQNGEDVRLWRAFEEVQVGFYVEVGGWDPEVDSVSRSFYGRGWSGIVMEPVAEKAAAYRARRPRDTVVQKLAGASAGTALFHEFPETGLSTTVGEHAERHVSAGYRQITHQLPITTLDAVLAEAPTPIHFLLIDTEGAEAEVLKGLDLGIYRPWVLVIESTLPNTTVESFEEWEHGVSAAGYSFACFDGLNRFYVAAEHADLAGRLALPPNVHDKFVTYGQYLDRMTVLQTIAERDSARALSEVIQIRLELVAAQLHNARLRAAEATQTADEAKQTADEAKQTADEAVRASEAIAASNRELSLELQAIVGSRSWRVTAPLRRTLGRG